MVDAQGQSQTHLCFVIVSFGFPSLTYLTRQYSWQCHVLYFGQCIHIDKAAKPSETPLVVSSIVQVRASLFHIGHENLLVHGLTEMIVHIRCSLTFFHLAQSFHCRMTPCFVIATFVEE